MYIKECALLDQRELRLKRAISTLDKEMEVCEDESVKDAMNSTKRFMEQCLRDIARTQGV